MQSGMPLPGFQDRRGKTILDRAQGCLPAGSQYSEIFLLAALGDAGAEILRDGGSIPPTSTSRCLRNPGGIVAPRRRVRLRSVLGVRGLDIGI